MSRVQKSVNSLLFALIFTFVSFYVMVSLTSISGLALGIATGWTLFTLILWLISYGYGYRQHQQALQGKVKAGEENALDITRTLEIDLSFAESYELTLEALQTLDGSKMPRKKLPTVQVLQIHEMNAVIGRIRAGIRTRTFGITDPYDTSRIEIQLQRVDDQRTLLLIESHSALTAEVLDYGRNLHYVNELAIYIRQAAAARHLDDAASQHHTTDDIPPQSNRSDL